MKHEMPAVTEDRRAELVNLLINRHEIMAPDVDTKRMEENMEIVLDIALAALTAEPVHQFIVNNPDNDGYAEWADCNPDYFSKEPRDMRRVLYTAPPAPVLRVPDELKVKNGSHQSHIDYAEGWADCIDEVKRLNAQPSPPEASNEQ